MGFRRHLSWLSGVWLCCQVAVLTTTPVSLLVHTPQAADAITCTCTHTGHDECPMHHPKQKRCQCRSTTDPDAASLISLLGPIAVLTDMPARLAPPLATPSSDRQATRFASFVAVPAGPPPRA